jgi:hypothetical protein
MLKAELPRIATSLQRQPKRFTRSLPRLSFLEPGFGGRARFEPMFPIAAYESPMLLQG